MMDSNASVPDRRPAGRDGFVPEELVSAFVRQGRWVVITFAIVAVMAIAALSLAGPRWEAEVRIRAGQVYDVLSGAARPVEPLHNVLERIRARSFLRDALKSKGISPDGETLETLYEGSSVDLVPATELIRVRARASSPDEARTIVTALFEHLSSMQGELMREARSGADLLAQQYTQELADLRDTQSNLQKAFSSANRPGGEDGAMALATLTSAMERNAREMRELDRQRFLLVQRNQRQSLSTEMIGEVSTVRIMFVRKSLIIAFGLVMGLSAGLVVGLIRDYLVRMRSQRLFA
ncbi:hypothetical protein [Bradyrhizobium sp.]|uniref:hypothetical protein n=1 Tax=Bradyrhizobium sp. TaxID=376 RepID=UPI0039E3CBF9